MNDKEDIELKNRWADEYYLQGSVFSHILRRY